MKIRRYDFTVMRDRETNTYSPTKRKQSAKGVYMLSEEVLAHNKKVVEQLELIMEEYCNHVSPLENLRKVLELLKE